MPARRDRQELGQPLDEAEHDGMEDGHGATVLLAGRAGQHSCRPGPRLVPVVADDAAEAQLGQEVGRSVEVGHLDVRGADRQRHVRVAAGAGGQTVLLAVLGGAAFRLAQRGLGVDTSIASTKPGRDEIVSAGSARLRRIGSNGCGT